MNEAAPSAPVKPGILATVQPLAWLVAILGVFEMIDQLVFGGAVNIGVRPREVAGLIGIPAHPFSHGGPAHLVSNIVGLLLFGVPVLIYGRREYFLTLFASTVVGGIGIWIVGRTGSVHIGASGIVYGLFGYIVARGFYERAWTSIVVSVVFAVMFGSAIAGAIPGLAGAGISWEAHFFGLVGGVLVARRLRPGSLVHRVGDRRTKRRAARLASTEEKQRRRATEAALAATKRGLARHD